MGPPLFAEETPFQAVAVLESLQVIAQLSTCQCPQQVRLAKRFADISLLAALHERVGHSACVVTNIATGLSHRKLGDSPLPLPVLLHVGAGLYSHVWQYQQHGLCFSPQSCHHAVQR